MNITISTIANTDKKIKLNTRTRQQILSVHIDKDKSLEKIKDIVCDFAISKLKHQDINVVLKQIQQTDAVKYIQDTVNNEGVNYFPEKYLEKQPGKVITCELFNMFVKGDLKKYTEILVTHSRVYFGNENKKYNTPFFSWNTNFTTHAQQLQSFIKNIDWKDLIDYALKKDMLSDNLKVRRLIIRYIFTNSKILNLSYCGLTCFPRNILRLFPHMEELDIRGNEIRELDPKKHIYIEHIERNLKIVFNIIPNLECLKTD